MNTCVCVLQGVSIDRDGHCTYVYIITEFMLKCTYRDTSDHRKKKATAADTCICRLLHNALVCSCFHNGSKVGMAASFTL